jgi:hypothetical protein
VLDREPSPAEGRRGRPIRYGGGRDRFARGVASAGAEARRQSGGEHGGPAVQRRDVDRLHPDPGPGAQAPFTLAGDEITRRRGREERRGSGAGKRAGAIKTFLVQSGVSAGITQTVNGGPTKPFRSAAENRRAEIAIV